MTRRQPQLRWALKAGHNDAELYESCGLNPIVIGGRLCSGACEWASHASYANECCANREREACNGQRETGTEWFSIRQTGCRNSKNGYGCSPGGSFREAGGERKAGNGLSCTFRIHCEAGCSFGSSGQASRRSSTELETRASGFSEEHRQLCKTCGSRRTG